MSLKKIIFASILCFTLTSCSSEEYQQLPNVSEAPTTADPETPNIVKEKETLKDSDTLNGVSKLTVRDYLSDEYFYDKAEIDFIRNSVGTDDHIQHYHIKIGEASYSDTPLSDYESFSDQQGPTSFESALSFLESDYSIYSGIEKTFLCIPVEITNLDEMENTIMISDFHLRKRFFDDRLTEFGFSSYGTYPVGLVDLWYDYPGKNNLSKEYYYVQLLPGETIHTNLLYLIQKEDLNSELYLDLYDGYALSAYDQHLKCYIPPVNKEIKFLKIHMEEESK